MKSLNAKKLIRILEKNGFVLTRQRGSHKIFKHNESGIIVPIPMHNGSKPIPIGTFLEIIKQSKILKDEFK